jgi:hypothetical protein
VLGTKPRQIVSVLAAFCDAKLGDDGRVEARARRLRLSIVVHRIGNSFELVLVKSAYLVEDRSMASRFGFRFELAAQVCNP